MIEKFYAIAENDCTLVTEDYKRALTSFKPDNDKLFLIRIKRNNKKYIYEGIRKQGIDDETSLAEKVFKVITKGKKLGPCAAFNPNKENTFFDKLHDFFKELPEQEIVAVLEENRSKIIEELKSVFEANTWVSLEINGELLAESEPINQKIIRYIGMKGESNKSCNTGVCYFCQMHGTLVKQLGIPNMAFNTLDKKENVSMNREGFNEYKMLQCCVSCQNRFDVKFSENILKNYVSSFYGLNFIFIPELISGCKEDFSEIKKALQDYNKEYKNIKKERNEAQKLKRRLDTVNIKKTKAKEEPQREQKEQKYVYCTDLKIFSDHIKDNIIFSLVLYEKANSQFIIYDLIESISKSRLEEISEIHDSVSNKNIHFVDLINFYKTLLKYEFDNKSKKNIEKWIRPRFLKFIKNLLLGSPIDRAEIITLYMNYINKTFYEKKDEKKEQFIRYETHKTLLLLNFLERVSCIMEVKMNTQAISDEASIEQYFTQNKAYDTSEKKACFIAGLLAKGVVNIQQKNLKSQPFLNRLKGFKLNGVDELRQLVTEAAGKLSEYEKNFDFVMSQFKKQFELTERWSLSNVELNFYLLLGYVSADKSFLNDRRGDENDEK